MTQTAPPGAQHVAELACVRMRLGAEQRASQPDPLGRAFIGYREGLTPSELWRRGRGVWKARLSHVAEAQLALVVASSAAGSDLVVAVGTVDGVSFHDGRVAVEGRVLPGHPLVGQQDPLANQSRNPVAFGTVRTVPLAASPQRPRSDVLADAVKVMTEAVRLRRPRMRQAAGGGWELDPDNTEPADWAEFVTQVLAAVAANAGGIEIALAGRPGSWEADGVRRLLHSTVGVDEAHLWEHRTEPLLITLHVNQLIAERFAIYDQYEDAVIELERQCDQAVTDAGATYETSDFAWEYRRNDAGDWVPVDPAAPAWSWEAWRESTRSLTDDPSSLAQWEEYLRREPEASFQPFTAIIAKNPQAAAEMDRRERLRDEVENRFDLLQQQLEQQRRQEWTDYGTALADRIRALAAELDSLTVPVTVHVDVDTHPWSQASDPDQWGLEEQLLQRAAELVPSPDDLPGTPFERLQQAGAPA